jgi:hypothetical protein
MLAKRCRPNIRQLCCLLALLALTYWLAAPFVWSSDLVGFYKSDNSHATTELPSNNSNSWYWPCRDGGCDIDGLISGSAISGSAIKDRLKSYWPGHAQPDSQQPLRDFQYSIKPMAYVFPQFHPIPENDRFWGVNFTEWVNVKKMKINKYGIPVMRPSEEVGYYNLLDLSTRKRWTQTIRNSS